MSDTVWPRSDTDPGDECEDDQRRGDEHQRERGADRFVAAALESEQQQRQREDAPAADEKRQQVH